MSRHGRRFEPIVREKESRSTDRRREAATREKKLSEQTGGQIR